MERFLTDIKKQFSYYKLLADKAMEQVNDEEFYHQSHECLNSIAIIVKHISGNLLSRFTQFRTTDGEKPWRQRDNEFIIESKVRADLMEIWEKAWTVLFLALDELTEEDIDASIYIREQPQNISSALIRSVTHASHHIGQILLLAKEFRKEEWICLSIPKGKSTEFNASIDKTRKPDHYTDKFLKD